MNHQLPPVETGRDLILSRAEQLFSANGYGGVSIRDIARACGVSNAAIYYHFRSKEELYIQVLSAAMARMTETLAAAAQEPGTCRERLERVAHTHACLALSTRSLAQFAIRDLVSLGPEAIRRVVPQQHSRIPEAIADILRQGMETGEVRPIEAPLAGYLLLGMLNALNTQFLLGLRDQLGEASIRFVVEVFMDGVAAHRQRVESEM